MERFPLFAVSVKNQTLPIKYRKIVTALMSCTRYKFILRVFDKIGCGVPDVYTLIVTTSPGRK